MKEIVLKGGGKALVDDEDYGRVNAMGWRAKTDRVNGVVYAYSLGASKDSVIMHRFILGCKELVDHRDRDGLNNQRYNLRPATSSQNQQNSAARKGSASKYKGVFRVKPLSASDKMPIRPWRACIKPKGRPAIHLGCFREEYNAAQTYNFAAVELFGEFARLNESSQDVATKVAERVLAEEEAPRVQLQ